MLLSARIPFRRSQTQPFLRQHLRWLVVAIVAGLHLLWVGAVAELILASWQQNGDEAFMYWWSVAYVDLPVTLVYMAAHKVAGTSPQDSFFWNYTVTYWLFLIGGSLQWATIAWLILWFGRVSKESVKTGIAPSNLREEE